MKRAVLLVFTLLSACNLYDHGNNGDDVICNGGGATAGVASYDTRDPETGLCNYTTTGGGDCDSGCCTDPAPIAEPTGSTCDGSCEALDENTCLATAGCHADYSEAIAVPDVTDSSGNTVVFVTCWDIEPLAPLEGGDCTQLDAYTCAQHDDCVSIMNGVEDDISGAPYGYYSECAAETVTPPDSCAGVDCGSGAQCEQQCYPCDPDSDGTVGSGCMSSCGPICVPDQTCDGIDCGPGYTCGESCDAGSGACFPACYPTGPTDPGSCTGTVTCGITAPSCPANTVAGIEDGCYTGFCIPKTQCGPSDPGSCDPSGVHCNMAPPPCPTGTTAGVSDGCWSGFCIPEADCPIPACETLTTQAACDARSDCGSVFTGMSCTCTEDGSCTCASETWARCESFAVTPPTPVPAPDLVRH